MRQNVGLTQHSGAKACYIFINHIGTRTHKHVTQETRNPQFSKFNTKSHFLAGMRVLDFRQLFLYIFCGDTSFVITKGIPCFSELTLSQRIIWTLSKAEKRE